MKTEKQQHQQKFLFFGGKGGVGKTTMAASTAVMLADKGFKTTIVSTDPTVSLSAVFNQKISATQKTKIDKVDRLYAVNINPSEATGLFQSRLSNALGNITNTFGGDLISTPCAEEMATFDQFVRFLDEDDSDVVVFDTAPTGHSLRELAMPFDWANFLQKQVKERKDLSVLMNLDQREDTIAHLEKEKKRYDRAIEALKDSDKTIYTLVLIPAHLPIEETSSAVKDLKTLGIKVNSFIINQMIPSEEVKNNSYLKARYDVQQRYLDIIEEKFGYGFVQKMPMLNSDVFDVDTLRKVSRNLEIKLED